MSASHVIESDMYTTRLSEQRQIDKQWNHDYIVFVSDWRHTYSIVIIILPGVYMKICQLLSFIIDIRYTRVTVRTFKLMYI